jgi:hypothetical protein
MKKATYTNKQTKEIYTLSGVKNIGQAWNLAGIVCDRMNWNFDMFACDVRITLS